MERLVFIVVRLLGWTSIKGWTKADRLQLRSTKFHSREFGIEGVRGGGGGGKGGRGPVMTVKQFGAEMRKRSATSNLVGGKADFRMTKYFKQNRHKNRFRIPGF